LLYPLGHTQWLAAEPGLQLSFNSVVLDDVSEKIPATVISLGLCGIERRRLDLVAAPALRLGCRRPAYRNEHGHTVAIC
jgi:hypothetical protein